LQASQTGATATASNNVAAVVNAGNGGNTSTAAVTLTKADVTNNAVVTFTGGTGADTIIGGAGADNFVGGTGADNIYGNLGVDIINVTFGADVDVVFYSAAQGAAGAQDSGAFNQPGANSLAAANFDVITGLATGDRISLNLSTSAQLGGVGTGYTGALGAQFGFAGANGSAANTVATAGADNSIVLIRGGLDGGGNFVGAGGGASSLLVYDSNATTGASSFAAIVLAGYDGANGVANILGANGLITLA
jgi:hypothetical protein